MLGGYKYDGLLVLRDSVLFKRYNSVVSSRFAKTPFLNLNSIKTDNDKIEFFEKQTFLINMSTTRSQKRRNTQREAEDNVNEGFISPINVDNSRSLNQETDVSGPSKPKSPRVENSLLENLRVSLKEKITSEIKNFFWNPRRKC